MRIAFLNLVFVTKLSRFFSAFRSRNGSIRFQLIGYFLFFCNLLQFESLKMTVVTENRGCVYSRKKTQPSLCPFDESKASSFDETGHFLISRLLSEQRRRRSVISTTRNHPNQAPPTSPIQASPFTAIIPRRRRAQLVNRPSIYSKRTAGRKPDKPTTNRIAPCLSK